jgi:replicative DNA helicase
MLNIEGYLQKAVLSLILKDIEFLKRAYFLVKPEIFSDPYFRIICKEIYNFYEIYKELIQKENLIFSLNSKYASDFEQISKIIDILYETLANPEYILDELNSFVRRRYLVDAVSEVQELIEDNKFEEIETILMEALKKGDLKLTLPKDYYEFDPVAFFSRKLLEQDGLKLKLGSFDNLAFKNTGIGKGKLVCVEGDEKGKKSYCLLHITIEAMIQGFSVLFISCEMSKEEVEDRIDCSVTNSEKEGLDVVKISRARKNLERYGGKLSIEEYPQNTCNVKEIEKILYNLEMHKNIIPDVVVVDYAEIMCSNDPKISEERHRQNSIFSDLKTLASKKKIRVFTATQVMKKAIGRKKKKKTDTGEDKRKLAHVDLMVGLGQDYEDEEQKDIIWVTAVANRHGLEGFSIPIKTDIPRGRFFIEQLEEEIVNKKELKKFDPFEQD